MYHGLSGIMLVTRLEALSARRSKLVFGTPSIAALIEVAEEVLSDGSRSREILAGDEDRQEMRRFLARQDADLLERLGTTEFARLLASLGLNLSRWRGAL